MGSRLLRRGIVAPVLVPVLVLGSAAGMAAFVFSNPPVAAAPSAPVVTTTVPQTTTVPARPAARGRLVIDGVGDVNLDPAFIPAFAGGYGQAFSGLDGLFLDDSLTIVNLECSPSRLGSPEDKAFTFRCDPDALPVARAHGVDVVNLANNHSGDFGVEALLDGVSQVERTGLTAVGVGADVAAATRPALLSLDGWTVAVLGMGGVVPHPGWLARPDHPGMASGDDLAQMVAAVEAADEIADLVAVAIHWGTELVTEPSPADRAAAEALIAAGADMVFGHHPHRLGALEWIGGRPVFWTLGNFIWPRLSDAGATTAVARVVVSPDGEIGACLLPALIVSDGHPELTGRSSCDGEE